MFALNMKTWKLLPSTAPYLINRLSSSTAVTTVKLEITQIRSSYWSKTQISLQTPQKILLRNFSKINSQKNLQTRTSHFHRRTTCRHHRRWYLWSHHPFLLSMILVLLKLLCLVGLISSNTILFLVAQLNQDVAAFYSMR